MALKAMEIHMDRADVHSSACSFLFNTVIESIDNMKLIIANQQLFPTLFHAKQAHTYDPKVVDKIHLLLEQLVRASPGPYIDAKQPVGTEPFSLKELAARVVAVSNAIELGMCVYKYTVLLSSTTFKTLVVSVAFCLGCVCVYIYI